MKLVSSAALVALICLTLACGYSHSMTPAGAGTMPTISTLSPTSTTAGHAMFVLTINGTNFNGNAVVNWNGTAQTTTPVSSAQLTISVPASAVATSGSVQVTVTNPGTPGGQYGGGTMPETSNMMTFTIN